jgi:RHS repeat-associated protein
MLAAAAQGGTAESPITWVFEPESFSPLAKLVGDARYSLVTDHLGTPKAMFDATGAEVWSASIDAYGDLRDLKGHRQSCPFRYPGQYEDQETGLYYNRFRYYDPQAGQFNRPDPIGLGGGFGIYQYVANPIAMSDSLGLAADGCGAEFVYDKRLNRYRDAKSGQIVSERQLPWPSNAGFVTRSSETLHEGHMVDRFGRPSGRYAGTPGASASERGLPPGALDRDYHMYRVLRPVEVDSGPAGPVPAFDAAGGSKQYMFRKPIADLLNEGALEELP